MLIGSRLPAPRDSSFFPVESPIARECYDRVSPTLQKENFDDCGGYVIIQNPSSLFALKNYDEEDNTVAETLSSLVVSMQVQRDG